MTRNQYGQSERNEWGPIELTVAVRENQGDIRRYATAIFKRVEMDRALDFVRACEGAGFFVETYPDTWHGGPR